MLSEDTVKNDLDRVYEKLGIFTHIELILYVLEQQQQSESEGSMQPSAQPNRKFPSSLKTAD